MKKKILPFFIIGILVLTSIRVVATEEENLNNKNINSYGLDLKISYLEVKWKSMGGPGWFIYCNIKNVGSTIINEIQIEFFLIYYPFLSPWNPIVLNEYTSIINPTLEPGSGGGVCITRSPEDTGLYRLYINMKTPGDIDATNNIVDAFYIIGLKFIFPFWPRQGLLFKL